jgi:hypothetical protein
VDATLRFLRMAFAKTQIAGMQLTTKYPGLADIFSVHSAERRGRGGSPKELPLSPRRAKATVRCVEPPPVRREASMRSTNFATKR